MLKALLSFAATMIVFVASAQQDCSLIYATPTGTGLDGTIEAPASLLQAIDIHLNNPDRDVIYLLEGNHNLEETLVVPSELTIEGGYVNSGNGWVKNSDALTILNINPPAQEVNGTGQILGVSIDNTDNVTLRDLEIRVAIGVNPGSFNANGVSITGIRAANSSNYTVERVTIVTGNAGNGVAGSIGSPGGSGSVGESGQQGCNDCGDGAFGGNGGFGGNAGGSGGRGGYGNTTGDTGNPGGGANGAQGGNGGSGDNSTCIFGCSEADAGSPGSNGSDGTDGSAGNSGITDFVNGWFIPIAGENGVNGQAGGGGGGGGGGGSACCLDDRGAGGGGGGGGGFGGQGGFGGGTGGSSIAFLTWNNNNGGVLRDVNLNPGDAGLGATGGQGGTGGGGGEGGPGGTGLDEGGDGGPGGAGGIGGNGGQGGSGGNGEVHQLFENGTPVNVETTGWPFNETYTVNSFYGCTNSAITLTKNTGNWDFDAMGTQVINDLLPNASSYNQVDNSVEVFYSLLGEKDLVTELSTISNFFEIRENRPLPTIEEVPDTLCAEQLLALTTSDIGIAYDWTVLTEDGDEVASRTGASPSPIELNNSGKYYVKLQVRDACCGWSVPVYDSTVVRLPIETLNAIQICETDSVFLQGAWQNEEGIYVDELTTVNGCDSIATNVLFINPCVDFGCTDPEALNYNPLALEDDGSCIFVDPENLCGPGTFFDEELGQCIVSCPGDLNYDGVIQTADLLQFLSVFSLTCEEAYGGN